MVKVVADKFKRMGDVGWWEDYEVLLRRYGLAEERGSSTQEWRSTVEEVTAQDWWEEVEAKSNLRLYRSTEEGFQVEKYVDSELGQEVGFG